MDSDTLKLIAGLASRHAMTTVAGSLVTLGLLHAGQDETSFVTIGSGILVGAAGLAWSWWQKSGQRKVAAALKRLTSRTSTTGAVTTAETLPAGAAVKK